MLILYISSSFWKWRRKKSGCNLYEKESAYARRFWWPWNARHSKERCDRGVERR